MGYAASLTLAVPNNPGLRGVSLFGQGVVTHPSNALGAVFSNGLEFKIGATGPISGQVQSYQPTATTGSVQPGGPVVQFTGVL